MALYTCMKNKIIIITVNIGININVIPYKLSPTKGMSK
jgi:hypothetical protein